MQNILTTLYHAPHLPTVSNPSEFLSFFSSKHFSFSCQPCSDRLLVGGIEYIYSSQVRIEIDSLDLSNKSGIKKWFKLILLKH